MGAAGLGLSEGRVFVSFTRAVWLSSVAVEGKTLRPSFVYDIAVGEHLLHGHRASDEQIQAWADEAEVVTGLSFVSPGLGGPQSAEGQAQL